MLAQWQQDLAERAAALKGRDGQDDPALKARMRDLEEEQRQIREALAKFLEDMQEHIEKLPDKPELASFAGRRGSLPRTWRPAGRRRRWPPPRRPWPSSPPPAATKRPRRPPTSWRSSSSAADGMGKGCRNAMLWRFSRRLSNCLGDTLAQLLAQAWPAWGGSGSGGMGGYGMSGLYGGLPAIFGWKERPAASRPAPTASRGSGRFAGKPRRESRRARAGETVAAGAAAGASEGAVPERYRRQVGQYFQRVAEETQEGAVRAGRRPRLHCPTRKAKKNDRQNKAGDSAGGLCAALRRWRCCRRRLASGRARRRSPRATSRKPSKKAAPGRRGQSGGEPDGVVQVANLVYAGTKSSRCFSDHFLIKAEKESSISTSRRFHAVKLSEREHLRVSAGDHDRRGRLPVVRGRAGEPAAVRRAGRAAAGLGRMLVDRVGPRLPPRDGHGLPQATRCKPST